MTIERRSDGTVLLRMHVPLWQSLVVLVCFLGAGCLFAYGFYFEEAKPVSLGGMDTGLEFAPWVWKALFLALTIAMLSAAVFIATGILRGGNPHVRLDRRGITVAGRPMASDVTMRWDEVSRLDRFKIQRLPAIQLKSIQGRKIELSSHLFTDKGGFDELCRQIEAYAALSRGRH